MDAKKFQDSYNSDKETRKERIVVGLSGGLDSFVTAYLLKIQKYEVIGVTVGINWENYKNDESKVLSCHITQAKLNSIKEFCHQMNITHYIVKSFSEFQENVVEEWLASRMMGITSNACWSCHDLRMNILYQKMKQFGAHALATGHFAKIFHQESHQSVYVHSSNDEQYDQSALLSRLPSEILKSLHLPLSDLQKKEVLKLAENFGLQVNDQKISIHECFPHTDETMQYLLSRVPGKLIKNGEILTADGSLSFGNHSGIINYDYAQPLKKDQKKDEFYVAKYYNSEKKIVVEKGEYFLRNEVFMTQCKISDDTPWGETMKGYIKIGHEFIECWIYPKSLNAAHVEWENLHYILEGEILSVHRKKGKNSKVFFTGKAMYLARVVESVEGERNVEVDYSRDF